MLLYNSQPSGNCYKVRLLLTQLGVPFDKHEVDVIDRDSRAELLGDKNPALRVPVLELDDGRHLAESNAIIWYLADGSPYLPDDPFERAKMLQWMFFEQYTTSPTSPSLAIWISILGQWTIPRPDRKAARARLPRARRDGAVPRGRALVRRRPLHDRRHRALRVHARRRRRWLRPLRLSRDQLVALAGGGRAWPHHDRRLTVQTVSSQLRRFLVAHNGYATRARTSRPRTLRGRSRGLSAVQLDSISTVDRAHRLTLTSRLGWYKPAHGLAAARARGGSSSTGRTRPACCPSSRLPALQAPHGAPGGGALVGP